MARHNGCPVLDDVLVWMVCEKWAAYEGGDHTIFVGHVLDYGTTAADDAGPLVHHNSTFHEIGASLNGGDLPRSAG